MARLPWRNDLRIPTKKIDELFPEMDCTRSPELLFPFPRTLGVLPPIPGQNEVGFFYWDQPAKARIKQLFVSVDAWDSRPYRASAEIVFCDACDRMPGLAAEAYQAFSVIKPGGVILRHDYSTAEGPTRFWEWLARRLPIFQIEGTVMLCLRVDTDEVYKNVQALLQHPLLKNSVDFSQD